MAKKIGYTPGPWKVRSHPSGRPRSIVPQDVLCRSICSFPASLLDANRTQAEANARLIAEAPALLETLKRAQARLCEHCPQRIDGEHVGDHTDECIEAQDAIAKAEGKE